jgi:hypothetical protein
MSVPDEPDESMHLSVEEMRGWLLQEIKDLEKASELRIKEAKALVEAYAKGELTPEGASKRLTIYEDRWGEALPGTHAMPHMTDEAIAEKIDKTRATVRARQQKYSGQLDRRPGKAPETQR